MIVTVNTDASYHPKYKIGAYAFWIVCNQGRIHRSGPLKEAKHAQDAELRSIANALYAVLNSDFTGVSKIIINNDCRWAWADIGAKKPSDAGRKTAELLRELKKKYFKATQMHLPIHEFRHVKAHSGTESPRKWVNDWCDAMAKSEMHKMKSSIQSYNPPKNQTNESRQIGLGDQPDKRGLHQVSKD